MSSVHSTEPATVDRQTDGDAQQRLDAPIRIIRPQAWITLTALILLVAAGLAWAFFGELPEIIEADGVLMRAGGVRTITAPVDGVIIECARGWGSSIDGSDRVATIKTAGGPNETESTRDVRYSEYARQPGRVLRCLVKPGERVRAGQELVQYELENSPRQVVIYLDRRRGYRLAQRHTKSLKKPIAVQVIPDNAKLMESGYLQGQVRRVAEYPSTLEQMALRLGDRALARQWFDAGRNLEVVVSLTPDRSTRNGYRWSTRKGGDVRLSSGLSCRVRIVIEESVSLIDRMVPSVGS